MGVNQESKSPPPNVSIDEALELFLALTNPNGLPEGPERDELLRTLRQKVASDRPDWAAASEQAPSSQSTQESPQAYAQVKAEITRQAGAEPVPEDPEERYFYERHREARQNRERHRVEERENRIREDLRRRLLAEKKEADPATVERTLRIREMLESRLQQVAPAQHSPEKLDLGPTKFPGPKLESLDSSQRVEALRHFNRERRAQLTPRGLLLGERRPTKPNPPLEPLSIDLTPTPEPTGLSLEDDDRRRHRTGLQLE